MKPHKVKLVATNASTYAFLGVCEYCGKTAFYGNKDSLNKGEPLGDCPNSPSYEAVIGRELLSMVQRLGTKAGERTEKE